MFRLVSTAIASLTVLTGSALAQIPEDLLTALRAGDLAGVDAALANGANPNSRYTEGLEATALMMAASNADPALVDRLLAAGAEVNTRDSVGDPAINWAAYYGHGLTVARLLRAGADTEMVGHGTPRSIMMRRGHQDALRILIEHSDPADTRPLWQTVLEVAIADDDAETVTHIARDHTIAEAHDWAGRPILHTAARLGSAAALDALLAHGVNVNASDMIGFTALHEAAREGQTAIVESLLAAGADPGKISQPSSLGFTPLHLAAISGDLDTIRAITATGTDMNVRGRTGATPMFWAAFEGNREAVEALIELGADTTLTLSDGTSMADVAIAFGWEDLAGID